MTINEINDKTQKIIKDIHPMLILLLETQSEYEADIFYNQITVYLKFKYANPVWIGTIDYQHINKLASEDMLKVDIYLMGKLQKGYKELLYGKKNTG